MISFENFKLIDGVPIYIQIIKHIKQGIVSGEILDNDEVPSRRALSTLLGINPNTIQKAYKELEDEGLLENRPGAKSFMSINPEDLERIGIALISQDIEAFIQSMKAMNLTIEEVTLLLEKKWRG